MFIRYYLILAGCILFPSFALGNNAPVWFPTNVHASLSTIHSNTRLIIPFFIRPDLYDQMIVLPNDISFRTHLFDIPYYGTNAMISPNQSIKPSAALWQNGSSLTLRWYIPSYQDLVAAGLTSITPPDGYRPVLLILPSEHLIPNLSRITGSIRIFTPQTTIVKEYFSVLLQWSQQPLLLNDTIAHYIQEGSLTCEFASAKNALDMLDIPVPERELIKKFSQAPVYDRTKSPSDYFLGDYGFDTTLPQTISSLYSPLGGYGLHIDIPYLEKIILPYAPGSFLTPFSFSAVDKALEEHNPIIVQGVFFSWQGTIMGGWPIQVDEQDKRGLVAGEHTYVIFEKTDDANYRIKDPYKRGFITISKEVVLHSILAFEAYGAKANMVVVQP